MDSDQAALRSRPRVRALTGLSKAGKPVSATMLGVHLQVLRDMENLGLVRHHGTRLSQSTWSITDHGRRTLMGWH